jgi:prevent-host-death family protein
VSKVPAIVPITDLRHDSSEILKRLRGSKEPMIITQRGRAAAVLLSVEHYERTENHRQLLLALAKGEQAIAAGNGHDLDEVLAEADAILESSAK